MTHETNPPSSRIRLITGGVVNAILSPALVFSIVLVRLSLFDQRTSFAEGLLMGAAFSAIAALVAGGVERTVGFRLVLFGQFSGIALVAAPFIAFAIWQLLFGGFIPGA